MSEPRTAAREALYITLDDLWREAEKDGEHWPQWRVVIEAAIRAEGLDVEAMLPWLSGNLSEEDYWTVRNALEAYARLAKDAER